MDMGNRYNTSKSGKTDESQESMLTFLQLIMSSKSKEKQQREAVEYIKSHPTLLMTTIKMITTSSSFQIADQIGTPESAYHELLKDTGDSNNKAEHDLDDKAKHQKTPFDIETFTDLQNKDGRDIMNATLVNEVYPKRRRKSKYCDLDGDLSNLRRDPKSANRHKLSSKKDHRECVQKKQLIHEPTEEKNTNRLLVRTLMDMLVGAESKQHQEFVLAILRADESLRDEFLREKLRMGKKKIPIFKTTQSSRGNQITASESTSVTETNESLTVGLSTIPEDYKKQINSTNHCQEELWTNQAPVSVPMYPSVNHETVEMAVPSAIWRKSTSSDIPSFPNDVSLNHNVGSLRVPDMLEIEEDQPKIGTGSLSSVDDLVDSSENESRIKLNTSDEAFRKHVQSVLYKNNHI